MQQLPGRLFLVKCFRHHKLLFFVVLLFILVALYGHKSSCEITPSLVVAMYSGSHQTEKDSFWLVTVNDSVRLHLTHAIDEPRRMMIFSTLAAYHRGVLAGYKDPQEKAIRQVVDKHPFLSPFSRDTYNTGADYANYLPWLLRYLQGAVDGKINKIQLSLQYIHYDSRNLPVADSIHSLYAFQQSDAR
ncbi:MAG: hypothetical protein ABUM51_03085 [Bacteroidota bacterium]